MKKEKGRKREIELRMERLRLLTAERLATVNGGVPTCRGGSTDGCTNNTSGCGNSCINSL